MGAIKFWAFVFLVCELISNLLLWKGWRNSDSKIQRSFTNTEIVVLVTSYFLCIVSGYMMANYILM